MRSRSCASRTPRPAELGRGTASAKPGKWIDSRPAASDLEMKMSRECRIRCADRTERLSLCYPRALRNSHPGERAVDRVVSAAVLKDDCVAVVAQHVGEDQFHGGYQLDRWWFRVGDDVAVVGS